MEDARTLTRSSSGGPRLAAPSRLPAEGKAGGKAAKLGGRWRRRVWDECRTVVGRVGAWACWLAQWAGWYLARVVQDPAAGCQRHAQPAARTSFL